MKNKAKTLVFILLLAMLTGCLPSVVPTEHDYVLVQAEGDKRYRILADTDPLYHQFDTLVLDDAYLKHLMTVYEHTTEAFIATNKRTSLVDTVSNRPILVLDSERVGVVRDVEANLQDQAYKLELCIGLGPGSLQDLTAAGHQLARALALSLLELAGMPHDDAFAEAEETLALDEAIAANWALREGFAAALEARYGAQDSSRLAELRALPQPDHEQSRRLARYGLVDLQTYDGDVDPVQSPEAVGMVVLSLLGNSSDYYPQRHMLWMTNYEPAEYAEAKLLLAINRLSNKRDASLSDVLASYRETFPSESDMVAALSAHLVD